MKTLIVTVTAIALAAVIGSIIVGERFFDGLVVEKPYDKGLQWDRERQEKAVLGWKAAVVSRDLHTGNNDMFFTVHDRDGKPLEGDRVTLVISRPSTAAYDQYYEPSTQGDAMYKVSVHFPLYGYWDLKINVRHENKEVVFQKRIYVEK
jgi:nitrogen fixation protein FixH